MPTRVAMICNTVWLDDELAVFEHLVSALAAEGVEVVQVVPDRMAGSDMSEDGERLAWTDSPWPLLRAYRLGRLAEPLKEAGIDLLHALDGSLWQGTLRLSRRLNVPAVLGASSKQDMPLAERLRSRITAGPVVVTATTQPLGDALRKSLGEGAAVHVIPPGVQWPEEPARVGADPPAPSPATASQGASSAATAAPVAAPASAAPDSQSEGIFCAAICGSGLFDPDCQALFEALPQIIEQYPQAQFFLDAQGHDQHPLWQAARRYGLLANMSMVPRRLGRREVLLMADMIIHPQPLGRSRCLTLQAMARGMPVLACADPWVDYLLHERTAWLIDEARPERWAELVRRAVSEPGAARELGERALQWVRPRHDAADYVHKVLDAYRHLTGQTLPFPRLPGPGQA